MANTALSELQQQIDAIRREAFEAGYAAAMKAVREMALQSPCPEQMAPSLHQAVVVADVAEAKWHQKVHRVVAEAAVAPPRHLAPDHSDAAQNGAQTPALSER